MDQMLFQKNQSTSQAFMSFLMGLPPGQSIVLQAELTYFYAQAPSSALPNKPVLEGRRRTVNLLGGEMP